MFIGSKNGAKLKKTKITCKCPEVSLKTSTAGLGSADVKAPVKEEVGEVEEVVEEVVEKGVEEGVEEVVGGLSVEVGSEATMGTRRGRKAIFANIIKVSR